MQALRKSFFSLIALYERDATSLDKRTRIFSYSSSGANKSMPSFSYRAQSYPLICSSARAITFSAIEGTTMMISPVMFISSGECSPRIYPTLITSTYCRKGHIAVTILEAALHAISTCRWVGGSGGGNSAVKEHGHRILQSMLIFGNNPSVKEPSPFFLNSLIRTFLGYKALKTYTSNGHRYRKSSLKCNESQKLSQIGSRGSMSLYSCL